MKFEKFDRNCTLKVQTKTAFDCNLLLLDELKREKKPTDLKCKWTSN